MDTTWESYGSLEELRTTVAYTEAGVAIWRKPTKKSFKKTKKHWFHVHMLLEKIQQAQ